MTPPTSSTPTGQPGASGPLTRPLLNEPVHYVAYGTPGGEYPSVCRAAIVTEVDQYQPPTPEGGFVGHVNLCVFNPDGLFFNRGVHHDELPPADKILPGERSTLKGGTWHRAGAHGCTE